MKKRVLLKAGTLFLAVLIVSCLSAALCAQISTVPSEPAGKKLFLGNKCNTCHSIKSMEMERKLASSKAPDLSNVGSEKNGEWITKWLKKEESLNGKKHQAMISMKDEDMKTLVDWLVTLKKTG